MARKVSKSLSNATIYVFDPSQPFEIDTNGLPKPNVIVNADGNPSANKARLLAQKACGSKNVMVVSIDVDETKLSVAPDVFMANSSVCVDGATYGHDVVTQVFKITKVGGFYFGENGMEQFATVYNGTTTENKMLNFVRDLFGPTAVITTSKVVEERRWMSRAHYLALAK